MQLFPIQWVLPNFTSEQYQAIALYVLRGRNVIYAEGSFEKGGRWYASGRDKDLLSQRGATAAPTRRYPW
jgi:hypothetical protein